MTLKSHHSVARRVITISFQAVFLQTHSVHSRTQNSMFPGFRRAGLFLAFPSSCPRIASVPLRLLGLPEAPPLPAFLHTSWAEEVGRTLAMCLPPARRCGSPRVGDEQAALRATSAPRHSLLGFGAESSRPPTLQFPGWGLHVAFQRPLYHLVLSAAFSELTSLSYL